MLHAILQRFKPVGPVPTNSEPCRSVTHIVVPNSAIQALSKDPYPLVQSVVDFTNNISQSGGRNPSDMPPAARQAYHCDLYLAQVLSGGHARFVGSLGEEQQRIIDDLLDGLEAMGARDFLQLGQKMAAWIAANPLDAAIQTGQSGGNADALAELDVSFSALNRATPLQRYIANWISTRPELRIIDDLDMPATLQFMLQPGPNTYDRQVAFEIIRLEQMLSDPLRLGLGMVAVTGPMPEPVISITGSLPVEIGGHIQTSWSLLTVRAPRFVVMEKDMASLYGRSAPQSGHVIAFKANATQSVPAPLEPIGPDDIGNALHTIPNELIVKARSICEGLDVGAAIHLLVHQFDEAMMVDFICVRTAGIDHTDQHCVSAFVTSQGGAQIHIALIRPEGAVLSSEHDREVVATVTREMIDAHIAQHQIPNAV